jgi:outer membrane lipase/esterase
MKLRSLLCSFFLCIAIPAFAGQHYDAIYVFGDSYCDTGNIYLVTGGEKPLSPPYYKGRFSNGPIWVEHLAGSFKLPMKASLAGGTDYAFGGAELLQDVVTAVGTIPSVPHQVDLYLESTGGHADPDALYVLEGGGNDVLDATSGSPTELGIEIGLGLGALEAELRAAGAKHFLIPNLFDVGLLPAGRANYVFDTAAIQAANKTLAAALALEEKVQGIDIYSTDTYALAHAIQDDPTHYGFTDILNTCLNATTGKVCADPAHTLFWDEDHPTEFGHVILAVSTEAFVHP